LNKAHRFSASFKEREYEISQGFQGGERWAFEEVAQEYFAYLVNFISQLLNDRDRALELAQEAFFLACRAHKQLNPKKGVTPWLFQIARNLAYKEFAKRKKQINTSLDEVMETNSIDMASEDRNPRDESELKEIWERVHLALKKVKPKYRDIIILRIMMGLPSEEVSGILNIPVPTVNTHTHRALKDLRRFCKQDGLREDEVFS
jgi:RNA polymerase sigma-70 factor, ECF subfamily